MKQIFSSNKVFEENLQKLKKIHVQQVFEPMEALLGYETRNKYRIFDEQMGPIAYAAETQKGFLAMIMRGLLKHWRSFEIEIFSAERELLYRAKFPFRWIFKSLYLESINGALIGSLHQRFAVFYKFFELKDSRGNIVAQIKSPWFKFWTFEFRAKNRKIGMIQKKWSGAMSELFTDRDNFIVTFSDPTTSGETKGLMMAACLMIDIVYFENNKGSK